MISDESVEVLESTVCAGASASAIMEWLENPEPSGRCYPARIMELAYKYLPSQMERVPGCEGDIEEKIYEAAKVQLAWLAQEYKKEVSKNEKAPVATTEAKIIPFEPDANNGEARGEY